MSKRYTYGAVAVWLCLTLLLTGCNGGRVDHTPATEAGSGSAIAAPVEAPADERDFTPVDEYASRLTSAFSITAPVPASDVTYTLSAAGAVVTGYTGGETIVVIPDTLEGYPVVAVAEEAFRDMTTLRALCLPDTVKTVGFGALQGCRSLATLKTPVFTCGEEKGWFGALFGTASYEINAAGVPSTLTTLILTGGGDVPDHCFYGCSGLEVVGFLSDAKQIGQFAFYGCDRLAYISLPEGLTQVGQYAFAHDASLLRLELPSTVETLGISLLEGCGKLESLTLPFVGGSRRENTYLAYLFGASAHTFSEGFLPISLIRVTLLPGCDTVPANAFYSCSRLREVILPEGVTSIGHRAFYRCGFLAGITLPGTLTSIGDEAFKGCVKLTSVDLSMIRDSDGLGVQIFMNCTGLTTAILSDDLSALPEGTFAGCTALANVQGGR